MDYLTIAAERITRGENLKEILLEALTWLGKRANVDRQLLDELLKISGVLHLIERDMNKGHIQPARHKAEMEYWVRTSLNYLSSGEIKTLNKKRNILFVSANPMESIIQQLGDQALIQAVEEFKDLEEAIRYHQMLEDMPLESIFEASFTELTERLNRGGLSILHFSNHGDENGIVLNAGDGFKEEVTASKLTGLLKLTKKESELELLFLNSCRSSNIAQIIHREMPGLYIISHAKEVPSDLVRDFAAYYYRMLAQNFSDKKYRDAYKKAFQLSLNKFARLKDVCTILEPQNGTR